MVGGRGLNRRRDFDLPCLLVGEALPRLEKAIPVPANAGPRVGGLVATRAHVSGESVLAARSREAPAQQTGQQETEGGRLGNLGRDVLDDPGEAHDVAARVVVHDLEPERRGDRNLLLGAPRDEARGEHGAAGLKLRHGLLGGGEGQLLPGPWVK